MNNVFKDIKSRYNIISKQDPISKRYGNSYCTQDTEDENNLKDVDDNVDRGIGNEHDVIPASQPFCPWRPLDDVTILDHLTRKTSLDLQKVKMLLQSKS